MKYDEKRNIAIDMYFNKHKSKSFICQKLEMSLPKLNIWIIETCRGKKAAALFMYFSHYKTKNSICNELEVSSSQLELWLDEVFDRQLPKVININSSKQSNKLKWVTNIIDSHRKAKYKAI